MVLGVGAGIEGRFAGTRGVGLITRLSLATRGMFGTPPDTVVWLAKECGIIQIIYPGLLTIGM